jgi:phosphate:Na+ symporter
MVNSEMIKEKIAAMAELALGMWRKTFRAFMEHNEALIDDILKDENGLNAAEQELANTIVQWARSASSDSEKSAALIYADVVEDLELIGDYCKDILERVQIKIEEKLMFSDEAVKEYEDLYHKTETALDEVVFALKKDNPGLVKAVFKNAEHIDTLVDELRRKHNQRLVAGICTPIACNMFLNMLDFTAAVYYHTKKVARNLLKIAQ